MNCTHHIHPDVVHDSQQVDLEACNMLKSIKICCLLAEDGFAQVLPKDKREARCRLSGHNVWMFGGENGLLSTVLYLFYFLFVLCIEFGTFCWEKR